MPLSQGAGPQCCPILEIPYLYLHPLMQNDQIWCGNTYREGDVSGVSHAIAYCTHSLHSLSALAKFLVYLEMAQISDKNKIRNLH